jgi:hypothetical protein
MQATLAQLIAIAINSNCFPQLVTAAPFSFATVNFQFTRRSKIDGR